MRIYVTLSSVTSYEIQSNPLIAENLTRSDKFTTIAIIAKPLNGLFTIFWCKAITASNGFSKRDNILFVVWKMNFFLHCSHLGHVNEFSSDYHSLDLCCAFIDLKENQASFQITSSNILLVLLGQEFYNLSVVSVEIVHCGCTKTNEYVRRRRKIPLLPA